MKSAIGPLLAALAFALVSGCASSPPPQDEVRNGLEMIMRDQGMAPAGASRVADCVTQRIYSSADRETLRQLAEGNHAVMPQDERPVSAAEAECVAATD